MAPVFTDGGWKRLTQVQPAPLRRLFVAPHVVEINHLLPHHHADTSLVIRLLILTDLYGSFHHNPHFSNQQQELQVWAPVSDLLSFTPEFTYVKSLRGSASPSIITCDWNAKIQL